MQITEQMLDAAARVINPLAFDDTVADDEKVWFTPAARVGAQEFAKMVAQEVLKAAARHVPATVVLPPRTTGVLEIAEERARQMIEKGYTPEHDAHHQWWTLAQAGACYADHIATAAAGDVDEGPLSEVHPYWPWAARDWKPTLQDPRRQLVKAGALLAAAIDAHDARAVAFPVVQGSAR